MIKSQQENRGVLGNILVPSSSLPWHEKRTWFDWQISFQNYLLWFDSSIFKQLFLFCVIFFMKYRNNFLFKIVYLLLFTCGSWLCMSRSHARDCFILPLRFSSGSSSRIFEQKRDFSQSRAIRKTIKCAWAFYTFMFTIYNFYQPLFFSFLSTVDCRLSKSPLKIYFFWPRLGLLKSASLATATSFARTVGNYTRSTWSKSKSTGVTTQIMVAMKTAHFAQERALSRKVESRIGLNSFILCQYCLGKVY